MNLTNQRLVDISLPLSAKTYRNNLPQNMTDHFAGRPIGFEIDDMIDRTSQFSSGQLVRGVKMRLHAGTHVDAPEHWVEGGAQIQQMPLSTYIGEAHVADLTAHTSTAIRASDLQNALGEVSLRDKRLLIKTGWNNGFFTLPTKSWKHDSPYLTTDALEWVIGEGVILVGVDFYHGASEPDVHEDQKFEFKLAKSGVSTLTNLYHLTELRRNKVFLIALPLALQGVEAAPVRAVVLEQH